jgi:hypothetical protein
MTSVPGSQPLQLRVNLDIVRGHFNRAARRHSPSRAGAAQFAAIRDIPVLIDEIERLADLLAEALIRHSDLRDAALATMTAYEADEANPLRHLRLVPSADSRRRFTGKRWA